MKKFLLISLISLLLFNCNQELRYTQNSKEIDAVKSLIEAYNNKDWATILSHYADSSKTRFNKDLMDSKEVPKYHQQNDASYSSRGFIGDNQDYEMVVDDKGRTWVNFWGDWKAILKGNNEEVIIHIHTTVRFVNGKIVEEYAYWDPSEVISNLQDIAAKNSLQIEE